MEKGSHNLAPLVGAWKLVSMMNQKPTGEIIYPFGKTAQGTILYTASGRFSVQLMRPDRPKFVSRDQLKGTAEEIQANYEGYIAYYGSYEFDHVHSFVTHHVEGSLFPNWEGKGLKRFVELSGNRLKLTTPPIVWGGDGKIVATVIWERVE